jgi:hypothetical protein
LLSATVLARFRAGLVRIDERVAQAQRTDALAPGNAEYKRRWLEAAKRGRRFSMIYGQAQAWLRKALGQGRGRRTSGERPRGLRNFA